MAHVLLIHYASPHGHKEFKDAVNNKLKYQYKGKLRRGEHQPYLSEVRLYDIRVKKELIPQLMRDLEIQESIERPKGPWYSGHFTHTVGRIIRLGRKFMGMKSAEPAKERLLDTNFKTWHYSRLVGVIPDLEEDGEEIL